MNVSCCAEQVLLQRPELRPIGQSIQHSHADLLHCPRPPVVQCAQTCFDAAARLIRPGAATQRDRLSHLGSPQLGSAQICSLDAHQCACRLCRSASKGRRHVQHPMLAGTGS